MPPVILEAEAAMFAAADASPEGGRIQSGGADLFGKGDMPGAQPQSPIPLSGAAVRLQLVVPIMAVAEVHSAVSEILKRYLPTGQGVH